MKLFKSLLLGTAAGLVATSGAMAADLGAKKPSPVEYVRTCYNPLWGTRGGFIIPGTDTCLNISGRVRADYLYVEPGANQLGTFSGTGAVGTAFAGLPVFAGGSVGRNTNATGTRARAIIRFDAINQTEWGALRSFMELQFQGQRGSFGGDNFSVEKAFIQFAGVTAGRFQSFFDYADTFQPNFGTMRGSGQGSVNGLAYTAAFGGGFSATISIEDNDARRGAIVSGVTPAVGGLIAAGYGGTRAPDLVGNLRVEGGWGNAQLSGIVHQIFTNGVTNGAGASTKYGFGVQGGVRINLPMIGAGSFVYGQVAYAEGVLSALGFGAASYNNGAIGAVDAVLVGNGIANVGSLKLSKGWSATAGLNVAFAPTLQGAVFGSYANVDHTNFTRTAVAPLVLSRTSAVDFQEYRVGANLRWTPIRGLLIGAEVIYSNVRHDRVGITSFKGTGIPVTTRGGDAWEGRFRIQRDF
jgi:hypothetical protein